MNAARMPRSRAHFKGKTRRRFVNYFDPLLGAMEVSEPSREPGEPEQAGALVICDSDLGDLVCSPAMPGNPRRTLAPPVADLALIVFVFFSVLAGGFAVAGVLHHG